MNRQLRRQAEGDRLQQEIQLLREEIRIKDARMEQLEAHRRPLYGIGPPKVASHAASISGKTVPAACERNIQNC
jgi:hypothetical protein